jgi:hypothetical protein
MLVEFTLEKQSFFKFSVGKVTHLVGKKYHLLGLLIHRIVTMGEITLGAAKYVVTLYCFSRMSMFELQP